MGKKKHKVDKKRRMDGCKMLWHLETADRHFKNNERIAPIYIDMGATKMCNIKCVYCYGNYQKMTGEKIEESSLIKLFEDAPRIGIKGIGLIGDGEPTLNPALYDAMNAGKAKGLDIAISTNGVLLNTDEKRENILRNCVWMRFNLSAGTREGYKKIHGVDRWNLVTDNIREMVKLKNKKDYDCEIGLQSVFIPGLMNDEIVKETEFALDAGVDYFLIKQCSLPDEGQSGMMQFDLKDYDDPEIQRALEMVESMSTDTTDIVPKWNLMELKGKRPYEGCLGIPFLLQISGNGKVYPCGNLFGRYNDRYLMGDLHSNSMEEIIKSERYWEVIEQMKTFDVHRDCKGQCRQDKINEFLYDYVSKGRCRQDKINEFWDEYIAPPRGINFI